MKFEDFAEFEDQVEAQLRRVRNLLFRILKTYTVPTDLEAWLLKQIQRHRRVYQNYGDFERFFEPPFGFRCAEDGAMVEVAEEQRVIRAMKECVDSGVSGERVAAIMKPLLTRSMKNGDKSRR